jgi:hypothetical protein
MSGWHRRQPATDHWSRIARIRAVGDPVGSNLYAYIFLGVVYALDRVQFNLSERQPDAARFAMSATDRHTGPHDGHHILEDAIEAIIQSSWWTSWPLEVVLAGGNFRQSRVHAALAVTPRHARTLQWRVQPEDRLPNFVELWVPRADIAAVTVTVTPPLGVSLAVTAAMLQNQQPGPNGSGVLDVAQAVERAVHATRFVTRCAADRATRSASRFPRNPQHPTAPCGRYTVSSTVSARRSRAWIGPQGKSSAGRRFASVRQSYFDDPRYVRFQQNSRPAGAGSRVHLVAMCSGGGHCARNRDLVSVHSRDRRLSSMARAARRGTPSYASMGPPSGGPRVQPDPDMVAAALTIRLHARFVVGRWYSQWIFRCNERNECPQRHSSLIGLP